MGNENSYITAHEGRPEFVLLGDSITCCSFSEDTQGFGLYLRQQYTGKVNVVNEGKGGYTSTDLKDDFDRIIARATSPDAIPTLLITIFLGANDATKSFLGSWENVPWSIFETNIRNFVDTILKQEAMSNTKIVLIGPPPTDVCSPDVGTLSKEEIERANGWKKKEGWYRSYKGKKKYAEGMMRIAEEYEETGRVVGLNFWQGIVDAKMSEDGTVYNEDLPPGSGLLGARGFGDGWFTDGLHLDVKGYGVLSKALFEVITNKWPELSPDRL